MRYASFILCALVSGCIDTTPMTIEEMNAQLGSGPLDGPICSASDLATFPPETLRMHVIDVGKGDAIWIQTPWLVDAELESFNVLIDTGQSGEIVGSSPGGVIVVDYLLRNGLNLGDALDAVVVTHAHADHYGGLPTVADNFDILRYVDPGSLIGSSDYLNARQDATGKAVIESPAADKFDLFDDVDLFGGLVTAQLLTAREQPMDGDLESPSNSDVNNTSVVFALQYPPRGQATSRQVLLMGDLEAEGEADLLLKAASANFSLSSHILKVGHHGSSTSNTDAFLAQAMPEVEDEAAGANRWAVISSGQESFGGITLPTEATVEVLGDRLLPLHLLSTTNRDEDKAAGNEHDDDHVVFTIDAEGTVIGCYAL